IYSLPNKRELLTTIERFGEKSIENMLNGIEASKSKPFEKVLFSLGIRHVGDTIAKKLATHFKNIDNMTVASIEEIAAVQDIGERIALSVFDYLHNSKHQQELSKLKEAGLQFSSIETEQVFAGDS